MYELMKKIVETGLEVQNKSIDFIDEMIKKGKIDEEDREKFFKELEEKMSGSKEKWDEFINEVTKKLEIKNPFASNQEIKELREKVDKLDERVKELEGNK